MESPINPDITCAFREAFLDKFSVYKNPYLTSVTGTINIRNGAIKATGSQGLTYSRTINLQNFSIFVRGLKINAYSGNTVQVILRGLRGTTTAFYFYVNEAGANRKLRFFRVTTPITSNADIVAGQTYNVGITVAGNVWTLFINGEVDKTQTTTETVYTINILHALFSGTASFLNGDIEDIMFFKRALTVDEMRQLNNNSLYKLPNLSANTVLDLNTIQGVLEDKLGATITNTAVTLSPMGGIPCADFKSASLSNLSFGDADKYSFNDVSSDKPFSIMAWVYIKNNTNSAIILAKDTGSLYEYWFVVGNRVDGWLFQSAGNNYLLRRSAANYGNTLVGKRALLTMTYNGSRVTTGIKLYHNVTQIDSTSASTSYTGMSNTTAALRTGIYRPTGANTYDNKLMPICKLINKELTEAEIVNYYNSTKHLFGL